MYEFEGEFYHFGYIVPGHKDREPKLHAIRDTASAMCLERELYRHGYEYAGHIINHPAEGPDLTPLDKRRFRKRRTVILQVTRPPLSDREVGARKSISRSFTELEELIFAAVRPWVVRCARSEILLSNHAAAVSPEVKERQVMMFRQNGGPAEIQACGAIDEKVRWERLAVAEAPTAAFLIYREELWEGGPSLLLAWAQAGTPTMVWCYKLATEYRHLLFTSSFVMGELLPGKPNPKAESIDFADEWGSRILGVAAL